jgi:hypothetical protein
MVCGIVGSVIIGLALMCAALIGSAVIPDTPMLGVPILAVLSGPAAMLPALNGDVRMLSTLTSLRATQSVDLLLIQEF